MAMKKINLEHEFMTKEEFVKYFETTEPFNIYTKDWKDIFQKED